MSDAITTRPATRADQAALSALINSERFVHRHLDWRPPLEWLDDQPFWLAEQNGLPVAVLAAPPDPPDVAWIRLFGVSSSLHPATGWNLLFPEILNRLGDKPGALVAAVSLQPWYTDVLVNSGFRLRQEIIVLEWASRPLQPVTPPAQMILREMRTEDLPAVTAVDNASFYLLWQNSLDAVTRAYDLSGYSTVLEYMGEIIGFQISTASPFNAHLARLAVLPQAQHAGLGRLLVDDLLLHFRRTGMWSVTVNTQSDNHHSLALYQKAGFRLTGESFPVYLYQR